MMKKMMKKILKYLTTEFRKENLYGDCHLEENGCSFPFRGKKIEVKILGLFWITYQLHEFKTIK